MQGPLFGYRAQVAAGVLSGDPAQELAAEKLQSLHHALERYQPRRPDSWKERFGLARRAADPPSGLYIFGDVGRGKSMLMDLFFATAPLEKKRRVHFHEFMLEVHARLHELRTTADRSSSDDPLVTVAEQIAQHAWLLCFDELHVVNIADAMLLGRLFQALFERGTIVVATSNFPPDDLYRGGLQRELFLPFIALLKDRLDLLHLDGRMDYRRARLMNLRVYHVPAGRAADRALDSAFQELSGACEGTIEDLPVLGRTVRVPRAAGGVARFSFSELCGAPLSAADYLTISEAFHTVIVSDIPRLGPERADEAKRFAALVDVLYEKQIKLICSAEAAPQDLYRGGAHSFEFRRTASRLVEMQSPEYLAAPPRVGRVSEARRGEAC
jgi:cell division protein ZapE